MRYKVTQTETIEYVIEASNENEVREFLQTYTTRELRAMKHDIKTTYSESIIEKTVMPADFNVDDDIPEILDDIPEELLKGNSDYESVDSSYLDDGNLD